MRRMVTSKRSDGKQQIQEHSIYDNLYSVIANRSLFLRSAYKIPYQGNLLLAPPQFGRIKQIHMPRTVGAESRIGQYLLPGD